jgi:hypothetical protein
MWTQSKSGKMQMEKIDIKVSSGASAPEVEF